LVLGAVETQLVAQARKSAVFLIMFGVVIMVSGCSRAEVKPGTQVSSSAWESLPMSSASAVVPQAAPTAITVRPNECPDVSRHDFAEAGVLSAGSFTAEDIGPQPERQDGHKVWIASQRKGHDDATLRITGPDGHAHLERRKSHVSWAAGVAQFYPGNLSVTTSGIYRLRIRVGRDTMCVRVHYRAA
jgi:hypothetical protein